MLMHRKLPPAIGLILSVAGFAGAQEQGAAPAGPAKTQEELGQLRDYVMDTEGAVQTAISDVNRIKKIKFSGYVQARYEDHQQGFRPGATDSNFTVRRARIKASAKPAAHTGLTLQIDMGGTSVSLRDAYVEWYPTAADASKSWVLTAGQFKWPFGYQVFQSTAVRETPERAQFAGRFVPGERDRGVMVSTPVTFPVRAQFGIFNGVGINRTDNNNRKDFVGRIHTSPLGNLDVGASVYFGRQLVQAPVAAVPATTATIPSTGEVITITPGTPAVPAVEGVKNRYGIDAQWVPMTDLVLKAEYVAGRDALANGAINRAHAWYALASYHVLPGTAVVAMFDRLREGAAGNAAGNEDIWHLGVNQNLTDTMRARLFYQLVNDHASVTGAKRNNNILIAEMLATY